MNNETTKTTETSAKTTEPKAGMKQTERGLECWNGTEFVVIIPARK